MKKKILSLLVIVALFTITGCGKSENKSNISNDKTYTVGGVKFQLDKKDDYEKKIYYLSSSKFKSNYSASTGDRLTLLKDENAGENLDNFVLMIYVNVQELKTINDRLAYFKNYPDSIKELNQSEKSINGNTWTYFTYVSENAQRDPFTVHEYCIEKKIGNYDSLVQVYFNKADSIDEFEEAFMNNVEFN